MERGPVPEAVIELDISTPWEPPDAPRSRPARGRPGRRLAAGLAVLAVAALLPAAAAGPHRLAPAYSSNFQVLAVNAGGGRFIVSRYSGATKPTLVALDARDGRTLWQRPVEPDENLAAVDEQGPLVQVERADENGVQAGLIRALDAETGAVRWERTQVRMVGLTPAGLVLVWQLPGPGEPAPGGFDTSYGSPDDPQTALPLLPHRERYAALDRRTGAVVWSVEVPPGTVPAIFMVDHPRILGFSELDEHGVLRVRDPGSGAVTGTYQLQRSGVVARHQAGVPGQVVVWPPGKQGVDVFDLASGRRLWHWAGEAPAWNGPVPCLRVRYCIFGASGTDVLDAATGARLWRASGYSALMSDSGDRLLMYRQVANEFHPDDIAAFDSRGALLWRRQGWLLAIDNYRFMSLPGPFVWRPVSNTAAIVGRIDPADGSVAVFGRSEDFYGSPQCAATGDRVGCLALGVLHVWPRP
ncbi:PQQ-binding-like beta-propeller repeat protein [Dactylosporangium sp. CA-233914]|uniref:outer membrane protein assembly factor BamB family protein n=1 Tax=Dactylosporangium sp. CA-233914 TaxID=3239934 RepID=UPI003D8AF1A5